MEANGRERFTHEVLVRERPIRLGRIEERDAVIDGCTNDRHAFVAGRGLSVTSANAHAAEAQRRHLQAISAKVHFCMPSVSCSRGRGPITRRFRGSA